MTDDAHYGAHCYALPAAAERLILAALADSKDGYVITVVQHGECVYCWRETARRLAAIAAVYLESCHHSREKAITEIQGYIAHALDQETNGGA
jgi:hypothetical protein